MKTVWVNRFNADGTIKPMNEWVQREINSKYTTHFATYPDGRIQEHDANFADNKQENLIVEICGKFDVCLEYIGDQRGDGWFYVADGEMPPFEPNAVLCHDGNGLLLMMPEDLHRKNAWNHRNKAKCWMPAPYPKYLD